MGSGFTGDRRTEQEMDGWTGNPAFVSVCCGKGAEQKVEGILDVPVDLHSDPHLQS